MKVLITGCRGFVGGTIGRAAAGADHEVLGIGRAAQPPPAWPAAYKSADVVTTDLSLPIREFAPDVIFHGAGTASVAQSFATPVDDLRASVLSWANVLYSVRRSQTEPLVLFPSSAAVYGQPDKLPVSEDSTLQPISPYGFHKACCELLAREYTTCFGLRVLICRFFSLFGESQRRLLVWELFRQFVGPEDTVWLQGTGQETRDHLSAEDMANAVLSLIESTTKSAIAGDCVAINLASGHEMKVVDLASRIKDLLACPKQIRCRRIKRAGDPKRWQADISLLRSMVPTWKSKPLEEGLAKCLSAWQREQQTT